MGRSDLILMKAAAHLDFGRTQGEGVCGKCEIYAAVVVHLQPCVFNSGLSLVRTSVDTGMLLLQGIKNETFQGVLWTSVFFDKKRTTAMMGHPRHTGGPKTFNAPNLYTSSPTK